MTAARIRRDELRVGDVLNANGAIVLDTAGWWKHPRYREFEPRANARGFAVAVPHRQWVRLPTGATPPAGANRWGENYVEVIEWKPDVWQISDVVRVNGRNLVRRPEAWER